MSVGWSSGAEDAILAGCRVEYSYYIDVEQDGSGSYGVNVVNITDYVQGDGMGRIKRTTSVIEKDWELPPVTVMVDNSDNYFTPNIVLGSRIDLDNIWQTRPSGEASPRECILIIKQTVTLEDGTTETLERFRGKMIELNPVIDDERILMELIARHDLLDTMDAVFTTDDGFSDSQEFPIT